MLKKLSPLFFLRRTPLLLVIDIGTTYFKIFLFDKNLKIVESKKIKNKTIEPKPGFAETNPTKWFFWTKDFLESHKKQNIQATGITGQRETVVFWDKNTGMAAYPAILWKDERTKETANRLKEKIRPKNIKAKTGLFWHYRYPIFKLIWANQHIEEIKSLKQTKRLCFGPPASWLIFNLTKERKYLTDHTQASRTLLYNLKNNSWDEELVKLTSLEPKFMPKITPNFYSFGSIPIKNKPVPILASIGDQEASLYQWPETTIKMTLSTGVFLGKKVKTLKTNPETETSIAFYIQKPIFLVEKRLDILGEELLLALKENNKAMLLDFQQKIAKSLKIFKTKKVEVDGGLIRKDKWGLKMREILKKLPFDLEFSEDQESSAKGTAKILKKRLKL